VPILKGWRPPGMSWANLSAAPLGVLDFPGNPNENQSLFRVTVRFLKLLTTFGAVI
jgi:hypothetical protein